MSENISTKKRSLPFWRVWANPIIRRYCRSRLRPRGLGISLLLTVLLAGFFFFVFRAAMYRTEFSPADAERMPLIPLLILQGVILFLLATGQVAGGITAEGDEGVLDYQRLAPMTPLAKVIGYLFGLPIREYAMFLATMPFTLWALWRGEVPLWVGAQLYAAVLLAAILYHVTGLVAGTVVKNRRWAFLVAMGVVFLLYTIIPQLAKFGLVYFKYLTLYPVFDECLPHLIPKDTGTVVQTVQDLMPKARFFGLDLPQILFTAVSQGALILTGLVMLWRRWNRAESHLMGKIGAVGFFAWVQAVLIGNALPLIDPGYLFPSRGMQRLFRARVFQRRSWEPDIEEALAMAGFYGLVSLALIWILTLMISPNKGRQLQGWRRARKLGSRRLSIISDPATAFPWVLAMALIGAGAWFYFTRALIESRWFPGHEMATVTLGAFLLVMLVGALGFHALVEGWDSRTITLSVIFVGVVPIMVGVVAAATGRTSLYAAACWLIGISPAAGPVYAAGVAVPTTGIPLELVRALPRAFWFWQGIGAVAAIWLIARLWKSRKAIAAKAEVKN